MMSAGLYDQAIAAALKNGPTPCRWVQFAAAGYDAAVRHGFPSRMQLTNAPSAIAPTVAEHAMAMMLSMVRRLPQIDRARNESGWHRDRYVKTIGTLDGQTLVIVGYGNIGRDVARRAAAFGMKVIAVGRRAIDDPLLERSFTLERLHEALALADVVLLAIPLVTATERLIDSRALAVLKPEAILVNVARGQVVDEAALIEVLQAGRLKGAALDVTLIEPPPMDSPLRSLDNVLLTPHVAGFGGGATARRLADVCVANLERFLAGQPLLHPVTL